MRRPAPYRHATAHPRPDGGEVCLAQPSPPAKLAQGSRIELKSQTAAGSIVKQTFRPNHRPMKLSRIAGLPRSPTALAHGCNRSVLHDPSEGSRFAAATRIATTSYSWLEAGTKALCGCELNHLRRHAIRRQTSSPNQEPSACVAIARDANFDLVCVHIELHGHEIYALVQCGLLLANEQRDRVAIANALHTFLDRTPIPWELE